MSITKENKKNLINEFSKNDKDTGSAGLAGLIGAQKIINFYLNLKDETNIMTISDGKKLSIDNIVIKSKHDCYLKSV